MFSFITGKTKKIGLRMLPGVADFTCAHLKLSCLIVKDSFQLRVDVLISFLSSSKYSQVIIKAGCFKFKRILT